MLDIGFLELVVIFVVALVVLGPTRLPGLVRTVGRWVGKARAVARDFQQQLENEANLADLNRMTDLETRRSQATTPPPPFTDQASIDAQAATTPAPDLASSGYPYGAEPAGAEAPQHAAEAAPAAPEAAAHDDTSAKPAA
jgi:sec-independent protein translocase protein TatB